MTITVIMGVSGAGKSTVGALLARRLGARFVEGDGYHPQANVEKMRRGVPLSDEDRRPWLEAIAADLRRWSRSAQPVVISCSALRRAYRDLLREGCPAARFVHLHGPAPLLAARLEARAGHYMPAALLGSQLALLEPPAEDEEAIALEVTEAPEILVARLLGELDPDGAGATAAAAARSPRSRSWSSPSRPSDP